MLREKQVMHYHIRVKQFSFSLIYIGGIQTPLKIKKFVLSFEKNQFKGPIGVIHRDNVLGFVEPYLL